MIVYMENPIDSTKKLLDLINEFGKTAGYKVNTQKSKEFLYTSNETAETEIRKNCSDFLMCSDLSNHQLKIDFYNDSLVYVKYMVTTNQKNV